MYSHYSENKLMKIKKPMSPEGMNKIEAQQMEENMSVKEYLSKINWSTFAQNWKISAKTGLKKAASLFQVTWDIYDNLINSADNFTEKHKAHPKLVMGILKLIALVLSVGVIIDLFTSIQSRTSIHPKVASICSMEKPIPSVLFCPKPYPNNTYGLVVNEKLRQDLGLTHSDLDVFGKWKMTGVYPTEEAFRILRKTDQNFPGFKTLESLWVALVNLTMNGRDTVKQDTASRLNYFSCAKRGTTCGTKQMCPTEEVFNQSRRKRRIWHLDLKSRCLFVERGTHFLTNDVIFTKYGNPGFWLWLGDLNTTTTEANSFIENDASFKDYLINYNMFEVKKSDSSQKAKCHDRLVYDGGIPYQNCSAMKVQYLQNYWVYRFSFQPRHRRNGGKMRYYNMSSGHGWSLWWTYLHHEFELKHTSGFVLETKEPFTKIGFIHMAIAIVDLFIGLSVFSVCSLLLDFVRRFIHKFSFLGIKTLLILFLLSISCYMVYREWYHATSLDNWFSTVFSIIKPPENGIALPTPSFYIYAGKYWSVFHRYYNLSKMQDHNVSYPLRAYIAVAAGYVLPVDHAARLVENVHPFITFCKNDTSCNDVPNKNPLKRTYMNMLFPFIVSLHDKNNMELFAKNVKAAYGHRYREITDYATLVETLRIEYNNLAKAIGHTGPGEMNPQKMAEYFTIDFCQVVISCSIGKQTIKNCCRHWKVRSVQGTGLLQTDEIYFENKDNSLLRPRGAGKEFGFSFTLNVTKFQFFINENQFNGSIKNQAIGKLYKDAMNAYNNAGKMGQIVFQYSQWPVPKARKAGMVIDLSFESEEKKLHHEKHSCIDTPKVVPVGTQQSRALLAAEYGYKAFLHYKNFGCMPCDSRGKVFTLDGIHTPQTRCCNSWEIVKLWTGKSTYNIPCFKVCFFQDCTAKSQMKKKNWKLSALIYILFGNFFGSRSECNLTKHGAREMLADAKELNTFLGTKIMNDADNLKTVQYKLPKYCHQQSVKLLSGTQKVPVSNDPGIMEINMFYGSLKQKLTKEVITFYPWMFTAIFFGAWSVYVNEAILRIILYLAALFKTQLLMKIQKQGKNLVSLRKIQVKPENNSSENGKKQKIELETIKNLTDVESTETVETSEKKGEWNETNFNLLAKNIMGILLWICIGFFMLVLHFFYTELIMNPYATIMKVDTSAAFPAPSVGICSKSRDIIKVFYSMNTECILRGESFDCRELFSVYLKVNRTSCLLLDLSESNANQKFELRQTFPPDLLIRELSGGTDKRSEDLEIWIGDLADLTVSKALEVKFTWEPLSSFGLVYEAYRIISPESICHSLSDHEIHCAPCDRLLAILKNNYICCLKSHGKRIVNLTVQLETLPCSTYEYYSWKELADNQDLPILGEIRVSKLESFLTTYESKDRFSMRGVFVLTSNYYGMLIGVSVFQLMLTVGSKTYDVLRRRFSSNIHPHGEKNRG